MARAFGWRAALPAVFFFAIGCGGDDSSGGDATGGTAGASGGSGGGGVGGSAGSAASGGSGGATGGSTSTGGSSTGGTSSGSGPQLGGCPVMPADNDWNRDISKDPVDPNSASYIAHINANGGQNMHPDFGSNPDYGIPFTIVEATQPAVPVEFQYADESDPGPYPIPTDAPIEGGASASGDRHVIVVQKGACKLYELFSSYYVGPGWKAGSGAIFDLTSNKLRPDGWTSADAAGLPILPGLVRYEEAVTAGEIRHALRFTVSVTQKAYIHPATHQAGSTTDPSAPPMGLRLRMKAGFDDSAFTGPSKVVTTALKKYGMFLADNGSNWFVSGMSNPNFDDDELGQLKTVPGSAFEVVQILGPIYK